MYQAILPVPNPTKQNRRKNTKSLKSIYSILLVIRRFVIPVRTCGMF